MSGRGGGFGRNSPSYADLMLSTDEAGVARSYLATDENFAVLKALETKNLLIPVVGNFAGPKAIRAVAPFLKERHGVVSAFYLSNVEQYLNMDGLWATFCSNVATLPLDESSRFIRSVRQGQDGYGPGLRRSSASCPRRSRLAAARRTSCRQSPPLAFADQPERLRRSALARLSSRQQLSQVVLPHRRDGVRAVAGGPSLSGITTARPCGTRVISRSRIPSSGGLTRSSAELIARSGAVICSRPGPGIVVARGLERVELSFASPVRSVVGDVVVDLRVGLRQRRRPAAGG